LLWLELGFLGFRVSAFRVPGLGKKTGCSGKTPGETLGFLRLGLIFKVRVRVRVFRASPPGGACSGACISMHRQTTTTQHTDNHPTHRQPPDTLTTLQHTNNHPTHRQPPPHRQPPTHRQPTTHIQPTENRTMSGKHVVRCLF
jgi:hypothetical protein